MREQTGFRRDATTTTRASVRQPAPSIGHHAGWHSEDMHTIQTGTFPPAPYDAEDFAEDLPRTRSSARSYVPVKASPQALIRVTHHRPSLGVPPRASKTTGTPGATPQRDHDPITIPTRITTRTRLSPRFLLLFLTGVLSLMLIGWMVIGVLLNWWQTTQNDWRYGRPRTYQTDAVVDHDDSAGHPSHFMVVNLNGHVLVYEIQGGDPAKSKIYVGPTLTGSDADLTPVTVAFRDVTGDHEPDMMIEIPGTNTEYILVNDHDSFRPAKPNEVTG